MPVQLRQPTARARQRTVKPAAVPSVAAGADPEIDELHQIRSALAKKYGGDMRAYSVAARAHAVALGFRFLPDP